MKFYQTVLTRVVVSLVVGSVVTGLVVVSLVASFLPRLRLTAPKGYGKNN